ncbi:unnamed protein product [Caretta caretta]
MEEWEAGAFGAVIRNRNIFHFAAIRYHHITVDYVSSAVTENEERAWSPGTFEPIMESVAVSWCQDMAFQVQTTTNALVYQAAKISITPKEQLSVVLGWIIWPQTIGLDSAC